MAGKEERDDSHATTGAGGDAHDAPPGSTQGGDPECRPVGGPSLGVQGGVAERLVEEGKERGAGQAQVEQAQVVPRPRRGVGGDAEAAGDAGRDGRAQVAQHTVEIETTEHVKKVTDGL